MFFRIKLFIILFFLTSCQPVELITPAEIDNSNLEKFIVNAKELSINIKYNPVFSNDNIEDQINKTPLEILYDWIDQNFSVFGNQNNLIINILDASILKKEIDNIDAKKFEEKTIYKYEIYFLVEYELYNDSNYLLANTIVETIRSTTSQKYISLNEREIIITELLNLALKDFIIETKVMMKKYMIEYMK